ncbi:molybdenum ABC transporter molybdate-binding protein [Humitalea rosea]|uniref:Molybdenum ABC transporter molybdate-binding protein n=1 Tax=Humitalea rosea TaxID=990373 RepID=A0A2W7IUF7_9PROT|nr:molybdate ABC transporter substrate-binding protein [Humitalea rosea]PZW42303.1 molybdenum ABC transporter molybdate-binding protein [Humitalea rosea]
MKRLALLLALVAATPASAEPVRLAAAGSLRAALSEVATAFAASPGGGPVTTSFGPSGLLRQRIAAGEPAEVFASANMEHPEALGRERGRPTVLFARNRLCAIARSGLAVTSETLLDRMLDPAVKLGISTPRADPSGDYAFALFARAEGLRPGARAALEARALQLSGGPNSPTPPPGRDSYAWQFERGAADIYLAYCTNALLARAADPSLQQIAVPAALSVAADYGLILLSDRPEAARFALFILSPAGQAVLARHGFDAPGLPQGTR